MGVSPSSGTCLPQPQWEAASSAVCEPSCPGCSLSDTSMGESDEGIQLWHRLSSGSIGRVVLHHAVPQPFPGWQLSMPWHGTAMIPGNGEASANLPMSIANTGLSPGGCGLSPAQPRHATAAQLGPLRAVPGQLSRPTGPPSSRAVARMPPGRPGPAWVWLITCMAGISWV